MSSMNVRSTCLTPQQRLRGLKTMSMRYSFFYLSKLLWNFISTLRGFLHPGSKKPVCHDWWPAVLLCRCCISLSGLLPCTLQHNKNKVLSYSICHLTLGKGHGYIFLRILQMVQDTVKCLFHQQIRKFEMTHWTSLVTHDWLAESHNSQLSKLSHTGLRSFLITVFRPGTSFGTAIPRHRVLSFYCSHLWFRDGGTCDQMQSEQRFPFLS